MNFIKDFYHKREIDRLEFLIWSFFIPIALLFIVVFLFAGVYLFDNPILLAVFLIILFLYFVLSIVIQIATTFKRSRSIGISLWWILLYFIPVVSFIYAIFLLLTPPGYFKPKELSTNPNPAPMTPPVSAETPTQTEDQGERG